MRGGQCSAREGQGIGQARAGLVRTGQRQGQGIGQARTFGQPSIGNLFRTVYELGTLCWV